MFFQLKKVRFLKFNIQCPYYFLLYVWHTITDSTITFTETEVTLTSLGFIVGEDGQPTLGSVTTTYTVTFEKTALGDTTYVSVKVKEKDNQESVESVIVEFGLSTEEIAELAKIQ